MSNPVDLFGRWEGAFVRLRRGVTPVRRARGEVVLVGDGAASRPVRLSAGAMALLPQLFEGVPFRELSAGLRERHPTAADVDQKALLFVERLGSAGMLEGVDATSTPRPRLWNLDPTARRVADKLLRVPRLARRSLLLVGVLCAVVGLVQAFARAHHASIEGLILSFDPLGAAIFALVVVPIHELAHAVACRAAGVPVTGLGIVWHGGVLPGPYVNTTQAYLIADRWRRFWIPAAGPLVDLFAAGASAWVMVGAHAGDGVGRGTRTAAP